VCRPAWQGKVATRMQQQQHMISKDILILFDAVLQPPLLNTLPVLSVAATPGRGRCRRCRSSVASSWVATHPGRPNLLLLVW